MDHIEKSSLTSGILFYKRYIDDVFIIGTTEEDLVETLKRLHSHDAKITLTTEDPERDGFSPFFNAKTRIVKVIRNTYGVEKVLRQTSCCILEAHIPFIWKQTSCGIF
ncbi:unnamed protein product [Haemonchus placei]|uniref:Reverse transcriptase domain-containing protein n=1 Tax=Haemonchus placei TaxID=6290 RepID=A0A3P7WPN7_HAEPC|nr:unnamed protein product [Haemonchus placei]